MDALLRSMVWNADKQVRKRGNFPSVLWLTEDAAGVRKTYDTPCVNAPNVVTDAELLVGLATDFAIDLAEAPSRVTKFAVAYSANRVTVDSPYRSKRVMQPKTTVRRKGVVIELHDSDSNHARYFFEILRSSGGRAMLGPVEPLVEPFDGPYTAVLARADEWRNKDAKVRAEAKAKAEEAKAKAAVKAEVKSVVKAEAVWPPAFLLNRIGEHGVGS